MHGYNIFMNAQIKCEIIWNELEVAQWQTRFKTIKRSNILQAYSYALATCKLNNQRARWGLIKINGVEAGLVQIIEARILFNIFHALVLDRGPVWFDGFGGAMHISVFFNEFNKQFPARWGRKRRLIPEVAEGATAIKILEKTGLTCVTETQKYETLWWNLEVDEETARANLKSNWRGGLKKAESAKLKISWHIVENDTDPNYEWFRSEYIQDKETKGYSGVSPQLLDNLALFSTRNNPIIIGKATIEDRAVAGVLFLTHGQSATYQIGYSSDEGRDSNAHHLLLWRSRTMLHSRGIKDLDLGGINHDKSAQGVKKFKQGTGAELSTLVGHFS